MCVCARACVLRAGVVDGVVGTLVVAVAPESVLREGRARPAGALRAPLRRPHPLPARLQQHGVVG